MGELKLIYIFILTSNIDWNVKKNEIITIIKKLILYKNIYNFYKNSSIVYNQIQCYFSNTIIIYDKILY